MTQKQRILEMLDGRVNNFENMADGGVQSSAAAATLVEQFGNPAFKAQFDLNFTLKYFTYVIATGVWTEIAAVALGAGLKNKLIAFLFGTSDFETGYTRAKQQYNLTTWNYGVPFIYGANTLDSINGVAIDATVKATLTAGDLVIPYFANVAAVEYAGLVIVTSPQVPFGQLLKATGSDIFVINGIRYDLSDDSAPSLLQFSNPFGLFRNNLFGAFTTDSFNPKSYKQPSNQQKDVLDLPLKQVIDKYGILAVPINYDRVSGMTLSIFVNKIDKLAIS